MTKIVLEVFESVPVDITTSVTTLQILKLTYLTEEGVKQDFPIKQSPVLVNSPEFMTGYVTKLNEKRWGFELYLRGGKAYLETDKGSPVLSVEIELI